MGQLIAGAPPTWSGRTLEGNWDVIWYYTVQHLRFTVLALALGCLLAFPLAYLAHRRPGWYPAMLGAVNVVYAIPSITMFVLLAPVFGFTNDWPVVVAMALYSLVILVRNIVEGLRAVPAAVVDASTAMGYRPLRRFAAVELPLAVPGIVAGLRVAAVSTISLISVAGAIGRGALGRLFDDGRQRDINIEILAGIVAVMVLALVVDLVIYATGRTLTPWARARSGSRP